MEKETKVNKNALLRQVSLKSCCYCILAGCRSKKNIVSYVPRFLLKKYGYSKETAQLKPWYFHIFSRELEGKSRGPCLLVCVYWMLCITEIWGGWGLCASVKCMLLLIRSWIFLHFSNLFSCANNEERSSFSLLIQKLCIQAGRQQQVSHGYPLGVIY